MPDLGERRAHLLDQREPEVIDIEGDGPINVGDEVADGGHQRYDP